MLAFSEKTSRLSIERLREIDPDLVNLDDQELSKISESLYELAEIGFDCWWLEKIGSKNPIGSFSPDESNDKLSLWKASRKLE